jgi:preprotein translocase subunit SecG
MIAVILTLHVLIVLGLIVIVLLQRSDGGALGIGGGGGGGFMSGRSAANALTRTTSILAAIFFATSLSLAMLAGAGESDETISEELTGGAAPEGADAPDELSVQDLLRSLGGEGEPEEPADAAPGGADADDVPAEPVPESAPSAAPSQEDAEGGDGRTAPDDE